MSVHVIWKEEHCWIVFSIFPPLKHFTFFTYFELNVLNVFYLLKVFSSLLTLLQKNGSLKQMIKEEKQKWQEKTLRLKKQRNT